MKTWIVAIIFILLFLTPFSYAETETVILDRGDSFIIENINVTLIDYNKKKEKLLVCVDGRRAILSDDKRVNQVYFEIGSFRDKGVKIQLEADCDDCIIGDNSECFPARNLTNLTRRVDENKSELEIEEELDEEAGNDKNETAQAEGTINEQGKGEKNYNGILKRIVTAILGWFS